jgi:hypothetical protein
VGGAARVAEAHTGRQPTHDDQQVGVDDRVAGVGQAVNVYRRVAGAVAADPVGPYLSAHVEELEPLIAARERVVVVDGATAQQLSVLRTESCQLRVVLGVGEITLFGLERLGKTRIEEAVLQEVGDGVDLDPG